MTQQGEENMNIVTDFLRLEIGTIKARIRNTHGIVDPNTCDHLDWNIERHICMKCGITRIELLESPNPFPLNPFPLNPFSPGDK
jgi:hypothetical protein